MLTAPALLRACPTVPRDLSQDRPCCMLASTPTPKLSGLTEVNQVKANMWEELGYEVTRDPLVNMSDEPITHL